MHKFMRNCLTAGVLAFGLAACGDDVTITQPPAPPAVPNITSFSVAPAAVTLTAGQTVQASYNLQLAPTLTGTVAWISGTTTVATVDASGKITAVAPGTAVITATATSGGQTSSATIGVTVVAAPTPAPAQISIASVTQGLLTLPVNLSNVNGQIEINLNFNPGGQLIDSVVSYIGTKRAAVQSFSANAIPAAGTISMSVNTANFRKNFNQAGVATVGATQVDFLNGPTTINAIVYPKQTTGQSAGNCTNAPPGVAAVCSSNTFSIVLNNTDSWASDMTKPTTTAIAANTSAAPGQTFWGGPAAGSNVSATLYPVVYTPGRSITSVTWTIGGCATVNQTALPFTRSFGYTAAPTSAQTSCTGYEWTGGNRDNVVVVNAIDNGANVYGPFAGLIPNTVVFNSTPDSIRLDYAVTSVNTPSIARTLPAVTGWVNASFNFINFSSSDNGVGLRATRDRAVSYNVVNCPTAGAQNVAMPNGTGADIPECGSNFIGGTPGLGGTAPYTVRGTESDRLGNVGTSSATATFGVDKTNPSIRWGLVQAAPALVVSVSAQTSLSAKPTTQTWRAEYLDDRAGFYNAGQPDGTPIAAQTHMLSTANHANPTGLCVVGTAPIGAAFVTAPGCGLVSITVGNILRLDGWQAGMDVAFPTAEAYYGYRTLVTDAAGNNSSALAQNAYVNANAPFATGLGLPAQITNAIFPVSVTAADSVEVINAGLGVEYPNVPTATWLRYNRTSVGTTYNDAITSPINTTLTPPTGAPYVRSLQVVDGTAFPGNNITGMALTNVKPINVQAWSFNPANFFTGSSIIPIPALNVQDGQGIAAWNAANPTLAVNHFRIIATVATSNQFGSTVPLRAQVVAPTNSPNAPFTRVDFYRLDAGGTWYNYLGSVPAASAVGSDQGTYRSWIYGISAPYVATWNGTAQGTTVVSGNTIIAVGVVANGDAATTAATVMTP
jgi:hypothetical protein